MFKFPMIQMGLDIEKLDIVCILEFGYCNFAEKGFLDLLRSLGMTLLQKIPICSTIR